MSFEVAESEIRERFTEALAFLQYLRLNGPVGLVPLDDLQKSMRGLWLVSIYAAFERSANAIVEGAIQEIISHSPKVIDIGPEFQALVQYSKVQSVKDCAGNSVIDKSIELFSSIFRNEPAAGFENPLASRMMNVDGKTVRWAARVFGGHGFEISKADSGRLTTLRERRNAVAHGREAASDVGERYTLDEMQNIYNAADRVSTAFLLFMRDHCASRRYLRVAA